MEKAARDLIGKVVSQIAASLIISGIVSLVLILAAVPVMKAEVESQMKALAVRDAEQTQNQMRITSKLEVVSETLTASVARREEQVRNLETNQRMIEARLVALETALHDHDLNARRKR